MLQGKGLGVTCCYFNPCGYKSKFKNFLKFYSHLRSQTTNIQIIELLRGDNYLSLPDHFNTFKVRAKGCLWRKENLLNIGIDILLCEGYENIAWLDSDVIFSDTDWPQKTIMHLQSNNLCQLFSSSDSYFSTVNPISKLGCVYYWLNAGNILPINESYSMGYGWAARSEVLYDCNLYDASIIGGGDSLLWLGSFNGMYDINLLMRHHPVKLLSTDSHYINFLNWSSKWGKLIDGKISYINQLATSLDHGSMRNRNYSNRYKYLHKSSFNPNKDLYYNDLGVLESRNSILDKYVFLYLKSRNEDNKSWFSNWFFNQ